MAKVKTHARGAQISLTAKDVESAVRKMYTGSGYVVLSQVRNGTGYERSARTADMLAISTWPSRGLFIEGIEIKVSRSDLQAELANPKKADDMAKYCTRWHLAMPEGLAEGLLLPPTWGIISVDSKLTGTQVYSGQELQPVNMDKLLVCAVLRAFADEYVPMAAVEPMIAAARNEERKNADARAGARLKELETAFAEFTRLSGVELIGKYGVPTWELGHIAEAVRMIVDSSRQPSKVLEEAHASLGAAITAVKAALLVRGAQVSKAKAVESKD